MDAHKVESMEQNVVHTASAPDNTSEKSELPVEVLQILSAPCQDEQCLDLRLQIFHKQKELEEKMIEMKQLECCILDLTTKMFSMKCYCCNHQSDTNTCETDSGIMEMSTSRENVEKAIFVNGLKFASGILANATENIELALRESNDNESANLPKNENAFVQEEDYALTSSPSKWCSDEIDSGVQIDDEGDQNAGVLNFPLGEQIKEELEAEEFSSPPIDENIRNKLIENARLENRKQMTAYQNSWTDEERALFEEGIRINGKDFFAIAKSILTKGTKECVEYYYRTKHIALYKTKYHNEWIKKTKKRNKPRILPIRKAAERKKREKSAKSIEAEQKENVGQMQRKNGKKKEPKKKENEASKKYEVDYIFGKRPDSKCNGKFEYRVFWKNYSREDATWEPEDNLKKCKAAIKLYEKGWGS